MGTLISAPEHSASYFDGATHVSEQISIGYYNTFHGDIYITWSLEDFLVQQNGRGKFNLKLNFQKWKQILSF